MISVWSMSGLPVDFRDDQVDGAEDGYGVGQSHALGGLGEQAQVGVARGGAA
jgi:hypothetical protein